MSESPRPTTAYAMLGLLALRSWTTYELAQQIQRSLSWFWSRAERRLYDEPKRLVADGLATATEGWTGRRRHTEYAITPAGREELRAWLGEPPAPRGLQLEAMVKVFFADAGSLEQLRTTLRRFEAESQERLGRLEEMIASGVEQGFAFPERAHLQALALAAQVDQEIAVLEWIRWAATEIEHWSSTTDPGDWPAHDVLQAVLDRLRVARSG